LFASPVCYTIRRPPGHGAASPVPVSEEEAWQFGPRRRISHPAKAFVLVPLHRLGRRRRPTDRRLLPLPAYLKHYQLPGRHGRHARPGRRRASGLLLRVRRPRRRLHRHRIASYFRVGTSSAGDLRKEEVRRPPATSGLHRVQRHRSPSTSPTASAVARQGPVHQRPTTSAGFVRRRQVATWLRLLHHVPQSARPGRGAGGLPGPRAHLRHRGAASRGPQQQGLSLMSLVACSTPTRAVLVMNLTCLVIYALAQLQGREVVSEFHPRARHQKDLLVRPVLHGPCG